MTVKLLQIMRWVMKICLCLNKFCGFYAQEVNRHKSGIGVDSHVSSVCFTLVIIFLPCFISCILLTCDFCLLDGVGRHFVPLG